MFDDTVWIPTHEIIKLARQNNIDLGTGNPEHRIRYLIKIGILPHQIRKMDSKGRVIGHLPVSVLLILKQLQYKQSRLGDGGLAHRYLNAGGTEVLPPSSFVTNIQDRKYLSPAWGLTLGIIVLVAGWTVFNKLNRNHRLAMPDNDAKAPSVTIIVNSPASFDKQKLADKILSELAVAPSALDFPPSPNYEIPVRYFK